MADRTAIIKAIRAHYGKLGIPLDALSDQEIEMGVRQLADAARESNTTQEQVLAAMRRAVEIAREQAAERAAAEQAAADAAEASGSEPG